MQHLARRLFLERLEDRLTPTFTSATGSPFPTGAMPAILAVGNLNAGLTPDIIIPNFGTNTITVYQTAADGSLTSRNDTVVGTTATSVLTKRARRSA